MGLFDGWQGFDVQEERRIGSEMDRIEMICKKLAKGFDTSTIAEHLELDEQYVKEICSIASSYAPDYEVNKIYEELSKLRHLTKA